MLARSCKTILERGHILSDRRQERMEREEAGFSVVLYPQGLEEEWGQSGHLVSTGLQEEGMKGGRDSVSATKRAVEMAGVHRVTVGSL